MTNEAPKFYGRLRKKLFVALNTNQSYVLPHAVDREHQQISYVVKESKRKYLPAFIKFNETTRTLIFQPSSLRNRLERRKLQLAKKNNYIVEQSSRN